jgi:hypothetical protein
MIIMYLKRLRGNPFEYKTTKRNVSKENKPKTRKFGTIKKLFLYFVFVIEMNQLLHDETS